MCQEFCPWGRGPCVHAWGGMRGGDGGMHGSGGARGHVWRGGGCVWQEKRQLQRWYASYWNAFLFSWCFCGFFFQTQLGPGQLFASYHSIIRPFLPRQLRLVVPKLLFRRFLNDNVILVSKTCYRPQRSWGKVIFSQASVILFTGGVCLSACWDTATPLRRRHPPARRSSPCQGDPPAKETTPPRSRLRHTVNERLVRILLECILVLFVFSKDYYRPERSKVIFVQASVILFTPTP